MSQKRYNKQYWQEHNNYTKPEILVYVTEQTRCNVCRTHLRQVGYRSAMSESGYEWMRFFRCPTCRKWYGSKTRYTDDERLRDRQMRKGG